MSAFTEADVERLVDIISEAQKRGIKHGSYTLARWILTAWSVEGSTPIASPARSGMCGDVAPNLFGIAEHRRQATEERTALVLDTTERTLRTAANWLESDKDSSMLVESANAVKSQGADEACCPVCEEVECDGDCPLATLRTAADGG